MTIVPEPVKRILPPEGVAFYERAFTTSYSNHGSEALAHEVAWFVTKQRMRSNGETLVACSEDFIPVSVFRFALEPAEGGEVIVRNADDGSVEFDAVLATTEPRRTDGAMFTEEALSDLADQINREGSSFPDVDHATLARLEQQYGFDVDALIAAVKREKGVFKSIKAAVKNGKLWIRASLDKRYHNYVGRFKNLSVEAAAIKTADNRLLRPRYIGFTFTNTPQLAGAKIAS